MELADHQWLEKMYFMWDVASHVKMLIYKLPTRKKTVYLLGKKVLSLQQISRF
jgi:hypothetical protein